MQLCQLLIPVLCKCASEFVQLVGCAGTFGNAHTKLLLRSKQRVLFDPRVRQQVKVNDEFAPPGAFSPASRAAGIDASKSAGRRASLS